MKLLLYLILMHLIADFILQNDKLAKNKKIFYRDERKKISSKNPLITHGIVVFLSMQILHFFFSPWQEIVGLTFLITIIHIAIDHIKLNHLNYEGKSGMMYFLVDQLIHLLGIILLSSLFSIRYQEKYLYLFGSYSTSNNQGQIKIPNILEIDLIYIIIFIVFSVIAGYIISYILEEYQIIKGENNEEEKFEGQNQRINYRYVNNISEKQKKIGIRIGMIERMLIIIFVASGQFGAIGLILAGKSLARFEELKDKNFSEYYLLGTLLSFLFGVIGGLVIQTLK